MNAPKKLVNFILPGYPLFATIAFCIAVLFSPMLKASIPAALKPTLDLIDQRLALMEKVAAYKFEHHLPIKDSERELIVLEKAKPSIKSHNLPLEETLAFLQYQMDCAVILQTEHTKKWQETGLPDSLKGINLIEDIRPEILDLNEKILISLAKLVNNKKLSIDQIKEFDNLFPSAQDLDPEHKLGLIQKLKNILDTKIVE